MGLFNKLKKEEKSGAQKDEKKKPSVKAGRKNAAEKKIVAKSEGKPAKKEFNEAHRVLKRPLVTEKSSMLSGLNQYIFEIFPGVTKNEVKKAVRDLYGVKVENVNVINIPGKTRRVGRHIGFRSGCRKAVVSLASGETIEIIAG